MIRVLGGTGRLRRARPSALAARSRARLDAIRAAAAQLPCRPRVFFEEWDDPLISGIRWVEELVEIAGGDPIFPELRDARLGKRSHRQRRGRHSPRPGRDHRVVVRQGGAAASGSRSVTDGRTCRAIRQRSHLRDQVHLHPAAGPGRAHRRRPPAAPHHRQSRAGDRRRSLRRRGTRRSAPAESRRRPWRARTAASTARRPSAPRSTEYSFTYRSMCWYITSSLISCACARTNGRLAVAMRERVLDAAPQDAVDSLLDVVRQRRD